MRCLIIEDEPLAAEVLEDYIQQVPKLELIGVCEDAIYALEKLQQEQVDVLFLDIHLPKLKGLDFLKILRQPPQVILTTAYHQYALQGYEYNVVDYLLKPIEFSRFLQAVNKLRPLHTPTEQPTASNPQQAYRFFNVNKRKIKVYVEDILYVESLKEYVKIQLAEQSFITKFQLGELEQELPTDTFVRIHRSFLVNKNKITAFTASEVEVSNQALPIGRSYKEHVLAFLENL